MSFAHINCEEQDSGTYVRCVSNNNYYNYIDIIVIMKITIIDTVKYQNTMMVNICRYRQNFQELHT